MMTQQSMMTQQTITALFDSRSDATTAVNELVKSGIPRTSIRVTPEADTAPTTTRRTSYDTGRDEKGFWASLSDMFIPENDRHTYAEAMHRGSIMVSATVDQTQAACAEDILEQFGTVDLEERETSWRNEGWSGSTGAPSTAASHMGMAGAPAADAGTRKSTDGNEIIPVVEEKLKVGKRQVSKGRVKVRTYVVETPVSQQVSLRNESVHVERRPVDRAVTAGEDAFREHTIEAQATSEEAVASKEARVTGEVVIKKDVEQRTKTLSDTVRSTKVDVEDERATTEKPRNDQAITR
jgi:uncharacterized protein (TIGR02271 family)